MDQKARQTEATSYFVDIWPILDELWEKEFKFSPKPAFSLRYIDKAKANESLLLAAKYGFYQNNDSYEFLKNNFGAEAIVYDAQFKAAFKPRAFHVAQSYGI